MKMRWGSCDRCIVEDFGLARRDRVGRLIGLFVFEDVLIISDGRPLYRVKITHAKTRVLLSNRMIAELNLR